MWPDRSGEGGRDEVGNRVAAREAETGAIGGTQVNRGYGMGFPRSQRFPGPGIQPGRSRGVSCEGITPADKHQGD